MDSMFNLRILLTWALLTFGSFGLTVSAGTVLSPPSQSVPAGDSFRLICTSKRVRTHGSKVRHELYKISGENRVLVTLSQATACETNYTYNMMSGYAKLTTVFTMEASEGTAGSYGCMALLENNTLSSIVSEKDKRMNATVRVCSKPELQVELTETVGGIISVMGTEKCGYKGELTWLVNGRKVPRNNQTPSEDFPAVEREDDTMEIRSTGCEDFLDTTCQITGVFKYISTERLLNKVEAPLSIDDCCVPGVFMPAEVESNEDVTTNAPPVIFPSHPMDVEMETRALEKEVLALQKDVLELKLEALPMQIRFLRRLNKEHSDARNREKVADI
ncbi:uncharacterized protein LOC110973139 [Acanthaster planci]|uniref:Uncharacterized protein LOC110973139 n=1 Tax=Acanthaster planci TaxID=133434 RepID=A0A8B7XF67_ACAPL|nr:uncharacterized protein LOC110973139 [Acanthaster planci]